MSREIDERIVEMRFDNEHFEKNVKTSMSTLDKFKQKLQFKNASKGFDDIEKAAKKTDLSPLSKSAEKVGLKFNAMYTMADQAFRNITNSAMAAGKRIVDSLTIDPIKTGLTEYETKINSVQVIKANTRGKYASEDEQMEAIYKALDELNEYADRTIYNYTQMTDNVGKFVAQTGDVEKSVKAVQGLANLAGASGASAADMARATYQMSQALSGTIRKIDWNSLRNANMAGLELKNMLQDLARVEGIDIDSMIATKGTFEETLEEGWLTGDLFMKAMNIYSDAYSEAELAAMGFNEEQIANFKDLAKTAQEATTEVKTFTQLFDVLKETAQSGWTQTWELIFGDFDGAKKMFTELQVYFSDIINGFSSARNMFLEGALNLKNPWSKIWEKLETSSFGKIVKTVDKVSSSVENATSNLEHFQKVVNDVWRGDYKNSDTGRYDLLEAAGYNHKVVQDLVNKGYNYKLTIEDVEESHKKFGATLGENAETMDAVGEAAENATVKFKEITDEQLEQAGLTKDEIKLYRDLADEAERTGVTMLHLVNEMSENDGRTMLIDSIKNAWFGLVTVIGAVRDAWIDIFPPMTVVQLYNIIKAIRNFSEYLIVHEETAENLTRTLRGLFAVLDLILTLVSLPVKIAFKAFSQLLGVLDIDILSVTAVLGDMLVGLRNTVDSLLDFTRIFEIIVPIVKNVARSIKKWFGNIGVTLQNGFGEVSDNVVQGLVNGLWNGAKLVGEAIAAIGKSMITKICEVLGIHSPSVVFFAIGGFIVSGLLLGIKTFFPEVWSTISDYTLKGVDIIKNLDWGSIFSAVISSVTAIALLKFADAVKNFGEMFGGVGEMLEDVGVGVKRALTGLKSTFKGIGASFRAKAVKDIAISLLILAGALVVLSFVPTDKLIAATVAIAVLGIVLGGLLIVLNKTSKIDFNKESFGKIGALILMMVGIAASMLILAKSLESLANIDFVNNWVSILAGVGTIVVMMGLIMLELIATTKFIKGIDFGKLALTIASISGLMLVMAITMKILSGLDSSEFGKGIAFVTAFGVIVAALAALSTKNVNLKTAQTGSLILRVGEAMLFMAIACKIIGSMSLGEMGKAAIGIVAFTGIVTALVLMTKLASDKDVTAAGKVISSAGVAILLMAIAGKIINTMSWEDMFQALVGIAGFTLIVGGLIAMTRLAGEKELAKVGTTILMISVAMGVLAAVATIMSFMDLKHLAKGLAAVTILGLVMTAMIWATSKAQQCVGNLIVMTVAIGLMAASVATLSLIDTDKLLASTASMALVLGMFAVMLASTKLINKEAFGSLILATLIVGVLGAMVAGLSLIDSEKALISTIALVTLMGAMTVLMIVLSKIKIDVANAIIGIVGLTAMLIPLWAFALSLAFIPSLAGKEKDIIILTGVMTVMTALLLAVTAVGLLYAATAGIAATGLAGLAAMAGLMWVFSLALANLKDFSENIPIIETLVHVMTIMTGLLVKVAIVGPLALIGVTALAALSVLMISFGAFATKVGLLVTAFPQLKSFLDTGIPILEQLAYGLGSVVSKFLTGLLSGLPEVGTILTRFIEEADGFITGIKMVDGDVLKGIGILVGAFVALNAIDTLSFVKSIFTGGNSTFESFGKGLSSLGTCISDFSNSMASFTDDQLAAVKRGAEALGVIAEAAAKIPNTGGVAGFFAGENNIDAFMAMIIGDGEKKGIKELFEYLSDINGDIDTDVIENVCNVVVAISKAAGKIPNSGGVAGVFAGNNDIDSFIAMIVGDGKKSGVKELVSHLASIELDDTTSDKINRVVQVITDVINAAATLKNNTPKNFKAFGENLTYFAEDLTVFFNTIANISIGTLDNAIYKVEQLLELCDTFSADSIENVANFGEALSSVAEGGIDSFVETFMSETSVDDAKSAINTLLANVVSKVKTKNNKKAFAGLGKYLIQGLAEGINNNTSIVTKAAKNAAQAAYDAAKDELDINSPSKKFMKVGCSVIEGFGNGITANLGNIKDAANILGSTMLEATQNNLQINSPSLVFNKEVGRYIVDGIAEGIKNNTSAEDAAKQKAQNIVTAFQNEIDKYDVGSDIAEKELELWKLGDGKKASNSEVDDKQLEYLNGELSRKLSIQKLRHDEWKETSKYFAVNSKEEREAWSKYLDAQKEVITIQTQITDLTTNSDLNKIDHDMRMLGLNYENWTINYPDAKESVKQSKLFELLDGELKLLKDKEELKRQRFNEIAKTYNSDSAEYVSAYEEWVRSKADVYAKEEEISDTHEQHLKDIEEAEDRVRESTYNLWVAENEDASDHDKLLKKLAKIEAGILDAQEDVNKAEKEYNEALVAEDATATEINNKLADLNEKKQITAELQNEKNDIEESILDLAKEEKSIASDIAKIKYDIWANTEGREAKDAEKEAKQLEYLNQQLLIQNHFTSEAMKEYTKAISEHGSDSTEATRSYKAYLEELRSLSELKNQILDLEESAADRQKRLKDKQDLAQTEYEDYIKRYEKYYTANGMSRDDLERDAKLVSGYDPANVVKNITNKTQTALESVVTSENYQNLLTGFTDMGNSYVQAVNDGVKSNSETIQLTVSEMAMNCVRKLRENRPFWVTAGQQLVGGLIQGVKQRKSEAIQAAVQVAVDMLTAVMNTLQMHSPSRAFAEIGEYSILGLVKGLEDNSYLSDETASKIGEKAIECLKSSISKISDVINSDLDTQPTIQPVLDLSNIRSGTARLNAMMSNAQAIAISDSRKARERSDTNQNGNEVSSNSGNTYQFTQNNYSPKALSRTEIYRQTKNQFAAMKEVLS